jgi:hypothetical protein
LGFATDPFTDEDFFVTGFAIVATLASVKVADGAEAAEKMGDALNCRLHKCRLSKCRLWKCRLQKY